MTVHQLLVGASPGDAVTEFALAIMRRLDAGGRSRIVAHHYDPALSDVVVPLHAASEVVRRGDSVLYHSSIGQPEVTQFLGAFDGEIDVYFHNVVPPEHFAPFDRYWASLLELGLLEMAVLQPRARHAIANSHFTAVDLGELGYEDPAIVPPLSNLDRLLRVEPDPTMRRTLEQELCDPIIAFIGQVLPQKRVELLLDAFHIARTHLGTSATLLVVGPARFRRYEEMLERKIAELDLRDVHFLGHRQAAELSAVLDACVCLTTASDWESYCVPLVEAFSKGVPVVARATTVVTETLGSGGLAIPEDASPAVLAQAWDDLVRRSDRVEQLRDASASRFRELSGVDAPARVAELVGSRS